MELQLGCSVRGLSEVRLVLHDDGTISVVLQLVASVALGDLGARARARAVVSRRADGTGGSGGVLRLLVRKGARTGSKEGEQGYTAAG